MAGTIKDYFPTAKIIGTQSYGKGSVQSLSSYFDGSSFKYTVAKWFTGKSKTTIDGVGITPDIVVQAGSGSTSNGSDDPQLDAAQNVQF